MEKEIFYENLAHVNAPFAAELQAVFQQVLQKGWFVLGEELTKFENDFAAYCGASYAAGVASGLDALRLSLAAAGLPKGSEVILPSNTFIASILACVHEGLVPVLAEPEWESMNLCPIAAENCINSRTSALLPVHLYGKMCDMRAIQALADRYGLILIEDAAQAHGSKLFGKHAGTFGHFGAFSFYPTKNLGALGDGGAVLCRKEEDLRLVRQLRNYGSEKKYYNQLIGINSRLDELQAAFLSVKLPALDKGLAHKKRLATIYFDILSTCTALELPQRLAGYEDSFHIFAVRHPERDALRAHLLQRGIHTEIHYPIPPHKQEALKPFFGNNPYPISEKIHSQVLSLPISFAHTQEEVYRVAEAILAFCR